MPVPITMMYAGIFAIFALILSARAGIYRGRQGISILFGDPVDMELGQRVRVHQNFLEYVPLFVILMGAIEANGGSAMFLFITGDLLILARLAHAFGLRHDNIQHIGRLIGAGGTAILTLITAIYALWLATPAVLEQAGQLLGGG